MSGIIEAAKCCEVAGEAWSGLSRVFDTRQPLPSYSAGAARLLGMDEAELLSRWKAVSEAFDRVSGRVGALGEESRLFPQRHQGHFIYFTGDLGFLSQPRVTVTGAVSPSLQAKSDTLSVIHLLVQHDIALLAPIDRGLPAYALSVMLRFGGKAIGISSKAAGQETEGDLNELGHELEEKGLVLSCFAPSAETPPWTVKLRNSFIAALSEALFLPEERDGGPAWAIADPLLEQGRKVMLSRSAAENPAFTWMKDRAEKGALLFQKEKDARKLFSKQKAVDASPDLFS